MIKLYSIITLERITFRLRHLIFFSFHIALNIICNVLKNKIRYVRYDY